MADQPYRVIVVEDDADVAFYTKTVLEKRGCVVHALSDPTLAIAAVASFEPDVVITDIEMPGITGLDLIDQIRAQRPGTPVVVMTAHVSIDYAVAALRSQADEFLTKPVASSDLISVVTRLADEFRRAQAATPPRDVVLAIGAHPDDVELGVGGLLAAHRAAGDAVTILTLSRGARGGEADDRQHESLAAAELIGARLFLEDLVDTQISNGDPTVGIIERVVRETTPTIVYTHSNHDRHQDHRAVHDATLVATRSVRTVACYQSPSATVDFRPNRFVSIDGFTDAKIALLNCFASQADIRWYLEPDFVVATARYWSRYGGGKSSEPLEIVRDSADVSVSRGAIAAAVRVEKQRQMRDEAAS
ncbi:MAG: response regulator [Microbacteriaceae bacterium]|jgi:LmbE family N-acetylglucosaminyl deacetylase/CheY-like chemotaxis protein|nr:response regulator [Microbacteriaceae bacterium]